MYVYGWHYSLPSLGAQEGSVRDFNQHFVYLHARTPFGALMNALPLSQAASATMKSLQVTAGEVTLWQMQLVFGLYILERE
jgi:hypothetical protein